jgi:hypothetical protein
MKWILAVGLAIVLAGCAHTAREGGAQVRKESLATAAPGEIYVVKVYVIKGGHSLEYRAKISQDGCRIERDES